MNDNAFNALPLLLAVPRAAAYRLVASGELPVRRLGGRVYVVTAGLRELVASDLCNSLVASLTRAPAIRSVRYPIEGMR